MKNRKLRFIIFVYATAAAAGTLAVGVNQGSAIQEGTLDNTDSQYECGRRQNVISISERIINGTEASIEDWPWIVGIYDSCNNLICGGSLINTEYVMTAAHCFRNQDADTFFVRLGTKLRFNSTHCNKTLEDSNVQTKTDKEEQNNTDLDREDIPSNEALKTQVICVEIESICTPIQETCGFFMKDIAVVKLKRSVNYTDYIQPICLPENCADIPANITAHVVGWGNMNYDSFLEYEEYEYENETEDEMCEDENGETVDENSSDLSSIISQLPEIDKCILLSHGLSGYLKQRKVDVLDQVQCTDQMNRTVPGHIVCVKGGPCHGLPIRNFMSVIKTPLSQEMLGGLATRAAGARRAMQKLRKNEILKDENYCNTATFLKTIFLTKTISYRSSHCTHSKGRQRWTPDVRRKRPVVSCWCGF
uniref:Putative serine protease n=1 Tax=Ixodes ricinus TaxID=34613 RepID=A0A147BFA6_IXORI